jgi:predicted RNA-binding Zn-ribbon protein involved in translation (DUF1610 family)
MRYFETQTGDFVAIEMTARFAVYDVSPSEGVKFHVEAVTSSISVVCGSYDSEADAEHAKLAVVLWAINDDTRLFSFKREESPAWKLSRLGPGLIDLIESAEAYRQMQERKATTQAEKDFAFENNHTLKCRRDYVKPESGEPNQEWIRGKCPDCGQVLVSNCYQVPGQTRSIVCWDCWNSLGPEPTCKYSKTL